jgi:hypothetical protein
MRRALPDVSYTVTVMPTIFDAFAVYLLFPLIVIAYLVLATVQLRAIAAGLKARDFTPSRAWIIALLLAYVPVIGGAAGVYGANLGWHWPVQKGLFRFFGPLLLIAATFYAA